MHHLLPRLGVLAVALALAGLVSPAEAQSCTTSWTDASGGLWSDAGNWSAGVPDASDNACIVLPGTYTVTLDVTATVNSLTLGRTSGAGTQTLLNTNRVLTLNNPSAILPRGVYDWQGGQLTGTLVNGGLVVTSSSSFKDLRDGTLDNRALVTMGGPTGIRFISDATFVNAASGVFDLQIDANHLANGGGSGTRAFVNNGLVRKSGGTGISTLGSVAFNNNATVRAETGTIRLASSSTHTDATFTANAGAAVQFSSGTHTVVGTLSGNPAGTVTVSGATLTGGQLDFGGTGLEWQFGPFADLTNVGLLRLTGSSFKDVSSTTVTNAGVVEVVGTTGLRLFSGGTFVNNALFDFQTDAGLAFGGGSPASAFVNNGLVRKSGGTGISIVSSGLVFNNNAVVRAEVGTLRLDANGTHTDATFTATAGAEVLFSNGTHTVVGSLSGEPAGAVALANSATLTGDALDFGGTGLEWRNSDVLKDITNVGLLRLTGSSFKDVSSTTVTNAGVVEVVGGIGLRLFSGGTFVNNALFDLQTDAGFAFGGGTGINTFVNDGVLRKSGGTGISIVSSGLVFDNNGTVSVASGEIDVNAAFNHADGARIQGTGTFDKTNATFVHDGDTAPGTSPGILTWQDDWTPSDDAALVVEIGGDTPGDDYDQLAVTGDAVLNGTLRIEIAIGDAPGIGDAFTVLTAAGELTGSFDTVEGPFGYTFTVDADEDADEVVVTVNTVPNFDLAAVNTNPTGSPIRVTRPGAIQFAYAVTNNTNAPITGDVFFTAQLGSTTLAQGRILSGTLPANSSSPALSFTQPVPGFAPPGTYTYTIKIGQFPSVVVDQVAFTVVVNAAAREAGETGEATPEAWAAREATPWLAADGTVLMAAPELTELHDGPAEAGDIAAAASTAVPETFGLAAAYPNPFRQQTTFALDVPEAARVMVAVYDALGRRVAVLLDGEVEAATHRLSFDASSLPSGVYLVRATGAGATAMQRVTLVR